MATRVPVDDDDDFVDKIPIIKTMNLVKTTTGRVYKRLCDEEILVGKTRLKVTCFCNLCVGSTTVKGVVSASEMAELKASAFGIFFKLGKIKWVNGQLLILLALNHVEPIKKSGEVDRLKLHIGDRIVEFKKTDFALITGLKFGRESQFEDTDLEKANDISTRYFNGKMSVSRKEVENVFKGIGNGRDKGQLDAVKLALLNIIVNHVVGNQGEHCRFTFPGFLFPLQVWAFETFLSLKENEICVTGEDRSGLWSRALRWETGVRPMHDLLEGSIFGTEEESVQWNEMVATTSEKEIENIAMLFSVGDSRKVNHEEINVQRKGKGKVVIRKKAQVKKMEKKTERSGNGTPRGTAKKEKNVLGDARENEPSLRDIMTTLVLMEKRNLKMRMEVTKLRIAVNAHTRLLNGYISRKRTGKRWHTSKKHTTEDNNIPSFDLGFESQWKNDATEHDVSDDVWEEDLNVEAEIGTQPGSCGNDLQDPLNDISTQEVEGRWLKTLHKLGLGKQSEKSVENQECEKGSTSMVKDGMQSGEEGKDVVVEDVPCTGVDEPKEASPMIVEVSASDMNGQENEIEVDVAGFTDKVETASQELQELPEDAIFFPTAENLDEKEKNPKDVVLGPGTGCDLPRAVCEDVNDSGDDDEVLNDEPCTQIVVYEAPMVSEAPPDLKLKQKRPFKCPDRFTADDLVVRRKTKRVRTESVCVVRFGGDEDEFMGPFPSDPNEMPAQEELMKHLDVIFYYLRMKGVEFGLEQRYMTTDTPFLVLLNTLCGRYMKKELTIEQATRNRSVRSTIMGGKVEYGLPWQSADFVYMPLNTRNHWTLLVLDIKQKLIRTYDSSIRRSDSKRKIGPFLPCLQMFLPKIMDRLGVYDGREEGPVGDDVLAVEAGACYPQQNDMSSCGMFVVKMAEFLMMGCDVGDMDDHEIAEYRKKMTVELLAYSAVYTCFVSNMHVFKDLFCF
ncbi:unnamed protein product [Cuscuta campestris]|uniref:Ubiquitin-like protease family profile domain-containing protein n=1 Tax=Cuscuta campestris TaxID=132261 RepID=A0A484KUG1_9ASTE|nr:unnamed protein product [Cuscuta campestris]